MQKNGYLVNCQIASLVHCEPMFLLKYFTNIVNKYSNC